MTLFEEAKTKMEVYSKKKEEAFEAELEAERAEYEAIKKFFLDHGITTGYGRCYHDDATIVKIKTAHSYDRIKEGAEGIVVIYPSKSYRYLHFHGIAFIPLTKQKKPSIRQEYTYTCAGDYSKTVVNVESYLEHVLADFEITDKTYSDEE